MRANGKTLLLKAYFRHRDDTRDRLKREFNFLEYTWSCGIRNVPQPLYADYQRQLGVYEFVLGRGLVLDEIQPQHIEAAVEFYRWINDRKDGPQARKLASASEACFSVAEHLEGVERRVQRLSKIKVVSKNDGAAARFVDHEIRSLWLRTRDEVAARYHRKGMFREALSPATRCLSPSDFGYHNVLLEDSGTLCFVDFEYAGWDDPAKLVCDFANQPDMLLPEALSRRFQEAVVAADKAPELLAERIVWLTPVYQLKWSCIILNDFLPQGRDRARFVGCVDDEERSKKAQLEKSRRMLKRAEAALDEACRS